MASSGPSGTKTDSGAPAAADPSPSGAEPTSANPSASPPAAPTSSTPKTTGNEHSADHTQRHARPPKRYFTLSPPFSSAEIPYHEDLGPAPSSSSDNNNNITNDDGNPNLQDFLKNLLDEVKAPTWELSSFKKTGTHTFGAKNKASGVEVEQYAQDIEGETWFARLSKHPLAVLKGWGTFDAVVRKDHSKHEGEYTPNIYDVNTVLRWSGDALQAGELAKLGVRDVSVEVTNMYHGIPAPLNDRVFSVLVVSGIRTDLAEGDEAKDESFVIQLPVDTQSLPESVKSRNHHQLKNGSLTYSPPSDAVTEANKAKVGKKLVQGVYASVEKLTKVGEETRWFMATTSNAKGVLPGWVQKKAVPGEIVKDVDYVYEYIEKHKEELEAISKS